MASVVSAATYRAATVAVNEPFVAIGSTFGTTLAASCIYQADSGTSDGTSTDAVYYRGYITTKPIQKGGLYKLFTVMGGVLHALKMAATTAGVGLIRNFGMERKDVSTSIAGVGAETYVVAPLDNATMAELQFVQFEFGDPIAFTGSELAQTWTLDEFVAKTELADENPM